MRKNRVAATDNESNSGKFQVNLKGQAAPAPTPESGREKEAFYVTKKMQAPRSED
jgi:hypothetical protein